MSQTNNQNPTNPPSTKDYIDVIKEAVEQNFYGTLEIKFRNGQPYHVVRSLTVLYDRTKYWPKKDSPNLTAAYEKLDFQE
jgi:hypothetical protein